MSLAFLKTLDNSPPPLFILQAPLKVLSSDLLVRVEVDSGVEHHCGMNPSCGSGTSKLFISSNMIVPFEW